LLLAAKSSSADAMHKHHVNIDEFIKVSGGAIAKTAAKDRYRNVHILEVGASRKQ
jgi:hypothetical protein